MQEGTPFQIVYNDKDQMLYRIERILKNHNNFKDKSQQTCCIHKLCQITFLSVGHILVKLIHQSCCKFILNETSKKLTI